MMPRDRHAQQEKRNRSSGGDSDIEEDGKWERVIVAEINRDSANERALKK
jgi:hypothetical protein